MLRTLTSFLAAGTLGAAALVVAGGPAQADHHHGTLSLAEVLAADGKGFDKNKNDFDILDNAVRAVLEAKPKSDVGVLADGSVALTAFAPNDAAFRRLVKDLAGERIMSEKKVFNTLAEAAGIDTIEQVLLYHVVPGATVTYRQAKDAGGAKLDTALAGGSLTVVVRKDTSVYLKDADPDDKNARVLRKSKNINEGNAQIAHGITQVLRPADL